MAVTQQRTGPLRGTDGQIFDLAEASVTKKKSRVPEIALGVLLVAGCALAALAWQTIADPSQEVLALRNDISRGELVTQNDLQTVQLASNDLINVIGSDQATAIVGQIAQLDLDAGTILGPNMVDDVAGVEPGQALVGITISRGELPSSTLRVGSPVDVIITPANGNDDAFLTPTGIIVLVRNARVSEIAANGDDVNLALAVTEADAVSLARAIAADRVRLVAVPEVRSTLPDGADPDAGSTANTAANTDTDGADHEPTDQSEPATEAETSTEGETSTEDGQ